MKVRHHLKSTINVSMLLGFLFITQDVIAQGMLSDYQRALNLSETISNKVFKDRVSPHWFRNNTRFWYRNDLPEGKREFILVNAEKSIRKLAFDHERLAAAFAKATEQEIKAEKLLIDRLTPLIASHPPAGCVDL